MASYNRVVLVGNLTRDVELRYLPSGMAVTEIGLAVNERRKTQTGEWVDEPVFVDVTMWGRTAEVASEYLSKGSPVLIEGKLKLDTWEKEGKKHSKLKVVADRMQMLGTRSGGGSGGPRTPSPADESEYGAPPSDFSGGQRFSGGGSGGPGPASAAAGRPASSGEPDADIPF